ncbi:MAG: ATP-binding protein [Actinomycetota bacterium]
MPATTRDDLDLLITELIANAFKHVPLSSTDKIEISVRLEGRSLKAEVCNPGEGFQPSVKTPNPLDESGRGLWIVESIASRWGVRSEGPTRVWFELDLADGGPGTSGPTLAETG